MNIPNLPVSPMVDKEGNSTAVELLFRQSLITALQQGAGPEGLVVPSQSADNINIIFNNTDSQGNRTAQPGTLLWDTTNEALKAIVTVSGTLTLKTVTLT